MEINDGNDIKNENNINNMIANNISSYDDLLNNNYIC